MIEEPLLKYTVLTSLSDTSVSCLTLNTRFIAVGTFSGSVLILDLMGTLIQEYPSHSTTVVQVCLDESGEFIASCSDQGKIIIQSLYNINEKQEFNYNRPCKSVALEPDYAKKANKILVSGGMNQQLLSTQKGWLGYRDTILHSGQGPIYNISWKGSVIAFACDVGVRMIDTTTQQKFAHVERNSKIISRADLFKCHFCWKSDTNLYIGWGDTVQIGMIKERSRTEISSGLPRLGFDILFQFQIPCIVSGIAPFTEESLFLLVYMSQAQEYQDVDVLSSNDEFGPRNPIIEAPQIHIVSLNGTKIAQDVLAMPGHIKYSSKDYHLGFIQDETESSFYIASPQDLVLARPRSIQDHIEWHLEQKQYEGAFQLAVETNQQNLILQIGDTLIQYYLDLHKYEDAADTCILTCQKDMNLWEPWIYKFVEANQVFAICFKLPLDSESTFIYNLILIKLLETNVQEFFTVLSNWPPVYDVSVIISNIESCSERDCIPLKESLILLYESQGKYDQVLQLGLSLVKPDILSLVQKHNLYSFIEQHALDLLEYDSKTRQKEGLDLLVESRDMISMSLIVNSLTPHPVYLHAYLHALFQIDTQIALVYHPMQVSLYAEYDPSHLLNFLKNSLSYDIAEAYKICEKKEYIPEMVYLLAKMGNNRKALMLIIEKLHDVKAVRIVSEYYSRSKAIEFAKERNDEELWEGLLTYSMDKPAFIVGLLENLLSFIDPLRIVSRIPRGLEIPGLKSALNVVLKDLEAQISLREGCKEILFGDELQLFDNLYSKQKKGLRVFPKCSSCSGEITIQDDGFFQVFFCNHVFHQHCLLLKTQCPLCSLVKFNDSIISNVNVGYQIK